MTDPTAVPWTAFDDGEIWAGSERIGAMSTAALAGKACAGHNAELLRWRKLPDGPMADPFCGRVRDGEFSYSDGHCAAFEPLDPLVPGHLLVVPKAHAKDALADPELTGHVFRFASELALARGMESCNLVTSVGRAATQSVGHAHAHIVPRRFGDGLPLPWTYQAKRERRPA